LFWVFIEILEHINSLNPNVLFFQEYVGSAPIKDVGIMSRALGVYPVRFNSELVTAQLRDRYYWTNIRTKQTMFDIVVDIPEPKDRKIMFKDILTEVEVVSLVNPNIIFKEYKKALYRKDSKSTLLIENGDFYNSK
jgi:DNA (cytosine-5)-methyltransferase 3A